MIRILIRKMLRVMTVLAGVTLMAFMLMHAVPGNPWSNFSSSPRMLQQLSMDEALRRQLDRRFGLDLPLWRQFTRYVIGDIDQDGRIFCGAICGNLGPSIQQRGRSVQDILFGPPEGKTYWESRFGYSARLVLCGAAIVVGLGMPLGIVSAARPKAALSQAISVGLATLISVPNFVLGLLAIVVLASWLKLIHVLPDWEDPGSWIVPAVVLAVMPMASLARVTRASVMHVISEEYVRAARAKGLTHTRVMLVHVMRNALLPIITFLGPALMEMFVGLLVVENLYSFPGFGREYWAAALTLDYPMLMGLTVIYAAGIALTNVVIDVLGAILDPRLRSVELEGARR